MKTVTIYLPNGEDVLRNVQQTIPSAGGVAVQQKVEEQATASGLIARVGGTVKVTMYPWHRILKIVEEDA